MANMNKKTQRNLYNSEIEARTKFPSFIVIESLEKTLLANLSPFLIEKVITSRATPQ